MKTSTPSLIKTSKQNKSLRLVQRVEKWTVGIGAAMFTLLATALPASAVTIKDDLTTESMIGGIIGLILEVAKWMGYVVIAAGIFMFIFAYKDDNAEAQSRAARFAVIGALLLGLGPILELVGLIKL